MQPLEKQTDTHKLTVNSPVTASKPTWMVCSKSDGREISGRSFFLLAERQTERGRERHIERGRERHTQRKVERDR